MAPEPRWIKLPPKDPPPPAPPVPEFVDRGRYLIEVEDVEEKTSSHRNNYFLLRCRVVFPRVHDDFRLFFPLSLTPAALWRLREFLEAIWNEQIAQEEVLLTPSLWIGKRLYADIEVQEYMGRHANRIGSFYPERKSF